MRGGEGGGCVGLRSKKQPTFVVLLGFLLFSSESVFLEKEYTEGNDPNVCCRGCHKVSSLMVKTWINDDIFEHELMRVDEYDRHGSDNELLIA